MLCDNCHEREATFTLEETQGDQTQESHLCHECTQKLHKEFLKIWNQGFLLPEWPSKSLEPGEYGSNAPILKQCPSCGYTMSDYEKTGLLGCEMCYEVFSSQLESFLDTVQASRQHVGKRPIDMEQEG